MKSMTRRLNERTTALTAPARYGMYGPPETIVTLPTALEVVTVAIFLKTGRRPAVEVHLDGYPARTTLAHSVGGMRGTVLHRQ